jgi:hypothetical protein
MVELHILRLLDWNINIPTSAEITCYLLYTAIPDYDFAKIIDRADCFSITCYEKYELSQFAPVVISIVSVVCTLEQFNQYGFRN